MVFAKINRKMIKEFPPNEPAGQTGRDLGIKELWDSRYSIPAVFYR
jgi:hypothetical protein